MTRWWCLALAALSLVTACSHFQPAQRAPHALGKVGDCYAAASTGPVDCNRRHTAQTVYVGRSVAPEEAAALVPCREAQAHFLGQDFNTRLTLRLWVAGDRSWYRCDVLLRNSTLSTRGYQVLTGSLQGVLRRGVSIALQACLGKPYDPGTDQTYVSCQGSHVAQELVVAPAIGTLAEAFPSDIAERAASACNATASAAGRVGGNRKVTAYYPKNAASWASGERTADCWVTATNGTLPAARPLPR
ncbi:MAG: septum formation family protein [Propionibacteriales bacterium]|nr:septum formation family protein [Propionibacteriales bacterium]